MKCIVARMEPTSSTFFQALMPDDGASVEAADPALSLEAAVRFLTQWLYLVGSAPAAVTPQNIKFQASGSKLILQKIVTVTRGVTTTVYRCICRELGTGSSADVIWGPTTVGVAAGEYVDCVITSSGYNNILGPYPFDDNAPPAGSASLIATVETERTARSLP